MRVTDSLVFQTATITTGRAREAALQAQQVASTGLRVTHPSDDPAASGLIVAFNMDQVRFSAISSAASAASGELSTAESALSDVSTQLSRARQLAVQFSSSGYTQAQSAMGGEEVDGIFKQIVSDLNVQQGNRYVFGGNQDGAPPFDATGAYVGDDAVRQVEIAPGVYQQANVRADIAIKGVGGGTDVLQTLQDLKTALQAGDPVAVQATLDNLDASINQVSAARSQAGVSMNTFDTAVTASKLASTNYKTASGAQSDADVIESSIQLQATQTGLQAALSASAQSFQLSLVNFLK